MVNNLVYNCLAIYNDTEHPIGKPLPPQNMVSLKQCAGVVLYTALNPSFDVFQPLPSLKQTQLIMGIDIPGAFIVENEIYTQTREYANNDADADKLWELSEKFEF